MQKPMIDITDQLHAVTGGAARGRKAPAPKAAPVLQGFSATPASLGKDGKYAVAPGTASSAMMCERAPELDRQVAGVGTFQGFKNCLLSPAEPAQ